MFPAVKIADEGEAGDQLRAVLDRKLRWFENLEKANAQVCLIHPLIARIKLPDTHVAALSQTARELMAFMRRIYRPGNPEEAPQLLELCEAIADEPTTYPNVTPGGVVQSRPFFAHTMQAFQQAWRDSVLWATASQAVTSVQQFTNLRIVPGQDQAESNKRPYATTTIHSDIWIGEPIDSVNGWTALCGDLEKTVIQFYGCAPGFLAAHFRHERRYDIVLQALEDAGVTFSPLAETISARTLYLFDCLVPHRTCQGNGGARLSIDGRLRTGVLDDLTARGPLSLEGREALRNQYTSV